MATKKKNTYVDFELEWLEKKALELKQYIDDRPFDKLKDRDFFKQTAKGGVVIGISDQFQIPVKYIGVGEGIEDLQVFNKYEFVDSFFK